MERNSFAYSTPQRDSPLSVELKKVIAERNLLTSRSRSKVLDALNEIHKERLQRLNLKSKATQEILSSELSYVQQLETIMKFFMEPLAARGLISPENFTIVFGHIETVYRVAGALVTELQTCKEDSLAPAFVRLAPFLKMYSLYACGYHKATNTLQELRSGKAGQALNSFLQAQESRPEVGCTLQSLLITPVQRLPRYRLLLKEVAAHTPSDHPHQITLREALKGVEASASHVDALLKDQEHQNRLVQLQQSLTDGWPQVVSPGRTFVMEGSFMKVSKCGTRAVPVQLILLTDMFLCCRQKSWQLDCRYAFPLARSCIETVLGQAVFKVLCGTETLLLFAKNQEEGEAWTSAMLKAIEELKSSRQTLKKQSSRKRIPKRIEDLEETQISQNVGSLLAMTLRKRKRPTPSQSSSPPPLQKSKKHRLNKNLGGLVSQSPPKDCLYPLRAEKSSKSSHSLSPLCFPKSRSKANKSKKNIKASKESIDIENETKLEVTCSSSTSNSSEDVPVSNACDSDAGTSCTPDQVDTQSWSAHCIELVRHVAQCIKSAVLRL